MRLSVQRHLILLFGLFLLPLSAIADMIYVEGTAYGAGPRWYNTPQELCDVLESKAQAGKTTYPCEITGIEYRPLNLDGTYYPNLRYVRAVIPVAGAGNPTAYYYEMGSATPCPDGGQYDGETGSCSAPEQPPEECREQGLAHDPTTKTCVETCEHGVMNGACLPPPEPENECTNDSPDYRGEIVTGYGTTPVKMCGDYDQCSGDKPGQVGFVNGELRCIAEDYGVPKCKNGTIGVIDNYGFACQTLENQPEEPDTPEAPNTDTDGDGEPDEYDRTNDPESVEKGLDKIEKAIKEGNAKTDTSNGHLSKIESATKSIADNVASLEQMGKNGELAGGGGGSSGGGEGLKNEAGEDYLGDLADIKQNTKDTADTLNDIKEGPEGGYNTDGLGDAPTFGESSERLQQAIVNHPTIQAVTTIPSIASNNTCPVWTIPATPVWDAMAIDSHCQILTDHRGLLSILFIAVWTLAAVFVFLRA